MICLPLPLKNQPNNVGKYTIHGSYEIVLPPNNHGFSETWVYHLTIVSFQT